MKYDMVKHKLRVTGCKFELRVTSWKLKRASLNSKVRIRIHELLIQNYEFRVQIHELQVQIYELWVQIHELQVQIYELRVQIYESLNQWKLK